MSRFEDQPSAGNGQPPTFFKVATVDARQTDCNDILTELYRDAVQAVVVTNVFSPSECASLVKDLESNQPGFPTTHFPEPFRSFFYGANVNLAHPDLADYFDSVAPFERALATLLAPLGGFDARVLGLLSRLDAGRSYRAAPGPRDQQHFMATTLRGHLEAGYIPPHFDNEQVKRPSLRLLAPLIEGDIFSFVITLQRAQTGGALQVYELTAEQAADSFVNRDTASPRPDLSQAESMTFDVADGTMVVVRSGRYLHRLTPVEGARTRWTFCTFMAKSRDGDAMLCWG